MKHTMRVRSEAGFSLTELLISMCVMLPIMAAAVSLFSTGANQQASEQTNIEANQDARSALEIMTREIAQAGSHRDRSTTSTATINSSANAQSVSVASTAGFSVGDWVDVDSEPVQLTAVSSGSISGIFSASHASNSPVRLFAFPYVQGVIPPAGLGANSSQTVTTIRLFGDINADIGSSPGDPNLYYVEYVYDSDNSQITRSSTPLTQADKNPAVPFIRNLKADSVQFTLNTDDLGVVTSASIGMTVHNTWKTGSKYQETELSTRVVIPSAVAGSALLHEVQRYGGIDQLPPTPQHVTTWASQ
jgi:type II secretory pathway pseudopilin PulG